MSRQKLFKIWLWCLILLGGAVLTGCAAQSPPQPQAAAKTQATPAPKLDVMLQDGRYCLWLFWTNDQLIMQRAQERLGGGQPFAAVAHGLARDNPQTATSNMDCLRAAELDPAIVKEVKDLKLGQLTGPFPWEGGQALVMRTTDHYRTRAQAFYDRGQYAEASRELEADLKLHPVTSTSWHLLGLAKAAMGDRQEAVAALSRAQALDPDNPAILQDKATTLVYMDKPDLAVNLYEKALILDASNPLVMSNLGWALALAHKDLARAEHLARRATELEPERARFWDVLGAVQNIRGEHAQAVVSYHRAARINPDSPGARERMAENLLYLDDQQVAKLSQKEPMPQAGAPAKPPKRAEEAPMAKAKPEPKVKSTPTKPKAKPEPKPEPAPAPEAKPAAVPVPKAEPPAPPSPSLPPAESALAEAEKSVAQAAGAREAGEGQIYLQVATLLSQSRTGRLAATLKKHGFNPTLEPWNGPGGKVWTRVFIGGFASQAEAETAGHQLIKKRIIQNFVVFILEKDEYNKLSEYPPKDRSSLEKTPASGHRAAAESSPTGRPDLGQEVFLQVASHLDMGEAEKDAEAWRKAGYRSTVVSWEGGGQKWFRVLLGPFPDNSTAEKEAQRLIQENKITSYRLVMGLDTPRASGG